MSKRTLTPQALFSQSNLLGDMSDFGSGIDFFDDRWLEWDGNGNANLRLRFLSCWTNPQTGAGLQRIKFLVRRSPLSGSNVVGAEIRLQQSGQAVTSFGNITITNTVQQLEEFTFDAALLPDPTGIELELIIDQDGSGTGGGRAGFDVGAAELIYEDGVGSRRLVRTTACDGRCCVFTPMFPIGAGTPEDPHQGSDCIHHLTTIGKQFHGCALINDISQQPAPGVKSILKGMEEEDALDIFTRNCINWPQNRPVDDDLGPCCWQWEDDV